MRCDAILTCFSKGRKTTADGLQEEQHDAILMFDKM
jgi:hypothetical protein